VDKKGQIEVAFNLFIYLFKNKDTRTKRRSIGQSGLQVQRYGAELIADHFAPPDATIHAADGDSCAVLHPLTQSREVSAMNGSSCPPMSNQSAQEVLPQSWLQVLTGCCVLCTVLHLKIQKSILGFAESRGAYFL